MDSNTIIIYASEDVIAVRSHFDHRLVAKAIPGARWDKDRKVWTYPSTAESAHNVQEGWRDIDVEAHASPYFLQLLGQAEEVHVARDLKGADPDTLPPVPSKTQSWGHQVLCFHSTVQEEAAAYFMGMGCGKSKSLVDDVTANDARTVLILAPKSVVRVWPNQFRTHSLFKDWVFVTLDTGSVAEKATQVDLAMNAARQGYRVVVIVNYESAWREPMDEQLLSVDWDYVVLDESHRAKNPSGRLGSYIRKLRRAGRRRRILTGTPMPHDPLDLWNQFAFLDTSIFGSRFTDFRSRYAIMGGFQGREILGWRDQPHMEARTSRITYRASADELDLPDAQHVQHPVELEPRGRRLHDDLMAEFEIELDEGSISSPIKIVRMLRMQQITSGFLVPRDADGESHHTRVDEAKQQVLRDLLEDTRGEPVVVFCRFRHDLEVIAETAAACERRYNELSGTRRDALDNDSRIIANADVVGAQIASGGTGIDLTSAGREDAQGAATVVYYSLGFSLSDLEQSYARVHRPGQDRPVVYHHLVATGSIDEDVYHALENRKDLVDGVLERIAARQAGVEMDTD